MGRLGDNPVIRLEFEIVETRQLEIDSAIRLWIFDMGRSGSFLREPISLFLSYKAVTKKHEG